MEKEEKTRLAYGLYLLPVGFGSGFVKGLFLKDLGQQPHRRL